MIEIVIAGLVGIFIGWCVAIYLVTWYLDLMGADWPRGNK